MPLISVVIPMRNAEAFAAAAVRSVLAQAGAGVALDVVVVDDGSTDRSADRVRALRDDRVRVVPGPRRGISAAFNAGLAEARGDLLARCDADDLYPPGRLARQAAWLDDKPGHVAVCGGYGMVSASGRPVHEPFEDDGRRDVTAELLSGVGRSHVCAYLFRTAVLRDLGGCREWFETSEDADLQFRLAAAGPVGYDPAVAYLYRLHGQSITHTGRAARREFFASAARQFLDQRRATGTDDLGRGTPPTPPPADAGRVVEERGVGVQVQGSAHQPRLARAPRRSPPRPRSPPVHGRSGTRRPGSARGGRSRCSRSSRPAGLHRSGTRPRRRGSR